MQKPPSCAAFPRGSYEQPAQMSAKKKSVPTKTPVKCSILMAQPTPCGAYTVFPAAYQKLQLADREIVRGMPG